MHNDQYYMQLVLKLAQSTPQQTLPNPQVAAVLVNHGRIVGIGCHLIPGERHAEILALAQAGSLAQGATLYINLEPCAHYGRTPPCAEALVAAKLARVVIAHIDPNPLVAGKGVERLRNAGITVEIGLMASEAEAVNQIFLHNVRHQQPYVSLKVGMSLDGKIATKAAVSKWITSVESRQDAHRYRAAHMAILVGVDTVISDDPSLTPHLLAANERSCQPVRIILDRQLRTPLTAKLIQDKLAQTWICTNNSDPQAWLRYQEYGISIHYFPELNLRRVLAQLYQLGICSLMVEGGEQIYASFLDNGCVNQIISYISPQLIGARSARQFYAGNGFADLTGNLKLEFSQITQLGDNLKIVSQVLNGWSACLPE